MGWPCAPTILIFLHYQAVTLDDNQDPGQVVAFFETQFLTQQAYCGFQSSRIQIR
jgi:hypothetical protein